MRAINYLLTNCLVLLCTTVGYTQNTTIFPPVGQAQETAPECFQLTNNQTDILGAIWFDPQLDLNQPFDIWVTLNFGTNFQWDGSDVSDIYPEAGGGADGIAFVLQQVSSAAGNLGEAIGYGMLDPSLAVEFDSYYNFNADPLYDHIAISKNGDHIHTGAPYGNYSEGTILGGATVVPMLGTDPVADHVQTGQSYDARFHWDPAIGTLDVWFNCELKISYQEDIVTSIFSGNNNVFYGFTSATGSEYNEHSVCVVYNSAQYELPDTSICLGNSVQLNAEVGGFQNGNMSYSWSPSTGLNDPSIANPIATPLTTTTYTVAVTSACYPDTIYESLTIDVTDVPLDLIAPVSTFCEGDGDVYLSASQVGGEWSGTGITDPVNGLFSPVQAGVGTHEVIYTLPGACAGSDTVEIIIIPNSPASISSNVLGGCLPLEVTFTCDQNIAGISDCLWDFGDGTTLEDCGDVTHTYTSPGCFDVSLIFTQGAGCSSVGIQTNQICVTEPPTASFTANTSVISPPNTQVQFTNESTNALECEWDFGSAISNEWDAVHVFPEDIAGTQEVCLTIFAGNECEDITCQEFIVEEELIIYVPNTFTPDGDDHNQTFQPVFTSGYDPYNYELLIFNRWGEIIFESHNAAIGWNGTYHKGLVQDGTYTWKITFKRSDSDKHDVLVGHVNILR